MAQNQPHFYFLIPLEGYKGNNFNIVSNKKTIYTKITIEKKIYHIIRVINLMIVVAITLY